MGKDIKATELCEGIAVRGNTEEVKVTKEEYVTKDDTAIHGQLEPEHATA